jgi:hypothetical protein
MNKIMMVAAVACLSAAASAQSAQTKDKAPAPSQSTGAPNADSAQTAGKRMHKPVTMVSDDSSKQAIPAVAKGGKTANDDWTTSAKSADPKTSNAQPRVATGDVNGDGVADATAKNSGHASETLKSATAPRDLATGHASGKRQHEPVVVTKQTDAASPK